MSPQAESLLAEADRHLAKAETRVARERELVARMATAGEDASVSREVLEVMERSLALSHRRRELLLQEIATGSL